MGAPPNDFRVEFAKLLAEEFGFGENDWPRFLESARTILSKMPQPTHHMLDAGRHNLPLSSSMALQFFERMMKAAV